VAKYTTEVRSICETLSGFGESKGYADVDTIIGEARKEIFKFPYPIFDEAYRIPLESKILEAYYTREIAHETVGLWKLKLQTKMRQIMPYYNQLYKSTLLEFNPLYDVNYSNNKTVTNTGTKVTDGTTIQGTVKKETGTIGNTDTITNTGTVKNGGTVTDAGTIKDTGSVTDNATQTNNLTDTLVIDGTNITTGGGDNKDAFSDTPQGGLSDVDNNAYLTNYRKVTSTSNNTENLDRTDTNTKTGTVNNDNTRTNDLTNTRNLTTTSDITTTNNLTNQRDSTITNNLTTDVDDTKDINMTDTINNTETYVETIMGKRAGDSYSDLLLKFRETFLNIDMQVIDELSELFFTLW
jgi:hypothetical protein